MQLLSIWCMHMVWLCRASGQGIKLCDNNRIPITHLRLHQTGWSVCVWLVLLLHQGKAAFSFVKASVNPWQKAAVRTLSHFKKNKLCDDSGQPQSVMWLKMNRGWVFNFRLRKLPQHWLLHVSYFSPFGSLRLAGFVQDKSGVICSAY